MEVLRKLQQLTIGLQVNSTEYSNQRMVQCRISHRPLTALPRCNTHRVAAMDVDKANKQDNGHNLLLHKALLEDSMGIKVYLRQIAPMKTLPRRFEPTQVWFELSERVSPGVYQ